MKSGTWTGAISKDNLRVIVNGISVPAYKATIKSSMRDGHPAAVSTSAMCVTATIEWVDPNPYTADVPHPFKNGWLPKEGSTVVIQSGDGALNGGAGQWWTQHTGVIDSTTGSIADGNAVSETVDEIEDLTSRVQFGALSRRMTPVNDSGNYREMGMCSTYLVDRMLRNPQNELQGWHATPPKTWQTIGSAPCQGSLWPEVGTLLSCSRRGDIFNGPMWSTTPYGVAPLAYVAEYNLNGSTDMPILSIGLTTLGSGQGRVSVVDADGFGAFVGHDRDTDEVVYGITTTGEALYRLPRNGATRAAIYFRRQTQTSQSLVIRLSDGREASRDPGAAGYPTGWAATRVNVDGRGGIGWWLCEGEKPSTQRWFTLEHVPTARIRVGSIQHWDATRDLSWTDPAEWLDEQLQAECAAMWLDEDGVMQWAGRDVLEAQPQAAVVTSTDDVVDIKWESRRQSLAKSVWVNYQSVSQRSLLGPPAMNAAEGKTYDLAANEEDGESLTIPDDEDWISPDLAPTKMDYNTTPLELLKGSKYGATLYQAADTEPGQAWAIGIGCEMTRPNLRRIAIRVWAADTSYVPVGWRIKTAIPEVADKLAAWHHGNPTIRVRARAILTWTEGERSLSAGVLGPSRYSHDVGWRVQTAAGFDRVGDLLSWLRTVVSSHNPTVTGLEVAHDPRRQIGDRIRVEDRDVTGMWWSVVITERSADTESMVDTLGGRITGYGQIAGLSLFHPSGPTAMTPATDWNREAVA